MAFNGGGFGGGGHNVRFQTSGMPGGGAGFEDILSGLFGGGGGASTRFGGDPYGSPFGAGGHAQQAAPTSEKGGTVRAKLSISFRQALNGATLTIKVGAPRSRSASLRASRTVRRSASRGMASRVCTAVPPATSRLP